MSSVDYVVVGAGSAGCALAAGLVERTDAHVLLLEAGDDVGRGAQDYGHAVDH